MIIADYSEWQGVVHPPGKDVVIIRAHTGYRTDHDWAANRAAAHAAGCPAVGIYQYLAADRDAGTQAEELAAVVGKLADNEWLICDLEEGAGDQQGRWTAWRTVIGKHYARKPWLYSGLAFAEAHDLQPEWVAAYQASEPHTSWPHKLWQNTDAYPWPWGKDDASVFDGTLAQFLIAVGIKTPAPTPAPVPQPHGIWHFHGTWDADKNFWTITGDKGQNVHRGGHALHHVAKVSVGERDGRWRIHKQPPEKA